MYYIYFLGVSSGGEWIEAANMKSAKWIFADKHGLTSIGYIAGRRKKSR